MAEAQMSPEQRKHFEDALIGFLLAHPEHIGEVQQMLPDQSYFTNHDNAVTYYFLCEMDAHGIIPKGRTLPSELFRLSRLDQARKRHLIYSYPDEQTLMRALAQNLSLWNKEYGSEDSYKELARFVRWHCHDAILIRQLAQDIVDRVGGIPESQSEEFATSLSQRFDKIALQVQDAGELQHISEATEDIEELLALMGEWKPTSNSTETGLKGLDNVLGGLNAGEVIVLAAGTGSGKSLPRLTFIPTPEGFRQVGDIQVGDMIFARDGSPTKVIGVFPQPEPLEVYEIELKDGRKVQCSEDHIWTVYRETKVGNKWAWGPVDLTVREMLDRGYVRLSKTENGSTRHKYKFKVPVCEPVEYPEAKLPVHPYVVGTFIGDGNLSPNSNAAATLSCDPRDQETVARIARIIGASDYYNGKVGHGHDLHWSFVLPIDEVTNVKKLFSTRQLFAELPELQHYAGDKCIPAAYKTASIEQRWELVRGLMDTDGTITLSRSSTHGKLKGQVSFSTTSEQLAKDFQEIMWSLGIEASISSQDRCGQKHTGPNGKEYVRKSVEYEVIVVCPNEIKERFFHLERKKALARQLADVKADRDYSLQPIVAIRDLGYKEDMTCFLVDNDEHLFLANDYVVTHNTALSMSIAENVALGIGTGSPRSVIIFSLEMMNTQLHFRMASRLGRINTEKFNLDYKSIMTRQERIDRGENMPQADIDQLEADKQSFLRRHKRLVETVTYSKKLPIYQDTAGNMNVSVMKTMISQKQKEMEDRGEPPLGLVIIDYLQILQPTAEDANENRSVVVGNMSRRIKQMAKNAGVPVLLLAQLNRQSDVDQKPKLSHLRESGSIEQDADKVIFLYCENASKELRDYASEYDTEAQQDLALKRDQMKVKIAVEKNRQGRQGEVNAIFDKQFQNFVTQTPNYKKGETFDQFFDTYYSMTRSGADLFWPMKPEEVPPELEKYRTLGIVENAYLGADGQIVLPNDGQLGAGQSGMTVTTRRQQPGGAPGQQGTLDATTARPAKPTTPPVNDLQSGFEEVPDDGDYENDPLAAPPARGDGSAAIPEPVTDDTRDPDERYDSGWHQPPFVEGDDDLEPPHADLDVDGAFYDGSDDEMFDLSTVDEFAIGDGLGYESGDLLGGGDLDELGALGDDADGDGQDDDLDGMEDDDEDDEYDDSLSILDEISKQL